MITSRLTDTGILIVQPSGALTREDFLALTEKADSWIEESGPLKGLLIDAPSFPGWKNFAALQTHLKFVRDHHRKVSRIAVASDSGFLAAMPTLARHFVSADIRRFEADETAEALAWIERPPEKPAHAIRHAWFPKEKLMWMAVDGKITTAEYRTFLTSLETILADCSPISLLVDLDDLEGVQLGAMMADLKFGLTHLKSFRRMALIGDNKWIHRIAGLPNPFPIEIKAFPEGEESDAWEWLTA
ncbi:MAG: STAS/SEC14 domain-containing protein [Verrucomicrobia bacterium]|nr:STAS/SEC14 domain-containing protein [Verrucomicrobiota bacterium]MDA1005737.1 STAS/SEC14 domain-containing protein [Verrucomicrobiota bacterium]